MARYGMVIDLERCLGCQTCTAACKAENATPPKTFWARVLKREIGVYPNAKRSILPVLCNHCEKPACVDVCPTGASYKRDDGIVLIDYDKCFGCRYCMMACPYQARIFMRETATYFSDITPYEQVTKTVMGKGIPKGVVSKCTLCQHRLVEGKDPACVVSCPGKARILGDFDDPKSEVSRLIAERKYFRLQENSNTEPNVYYLAQIKPTIAGETIEKGLVDVEQNCSITLKLG